MFMALALFVMVFFVVLLSTSGSNSYRCKAIMTGNEIEFFHRLQRSLPEHYIFPQVAMSALLDPAATNPKKWWKAFGRISQKRVDYAVYDRAMALLVIVELDDRMHDRAKDILRDAYFTSAGIRTCRFESRQKPSESVIRQVLLG